VNGLNDRFCGGCGGAMVLSIRGSSPAMRPGAPNASEVTIPLDIIKDALSGEDL
jgi:hypothetical protein